jgi:two-component system chemotaxis response regulator CheY
VKILVADDDALSRRLTESVLQKVGHEVTAVGDGRQAWEALSQGGYDLAVLDWMMPEMDGVALCRRFHRRIAEDHLYIILLTSRGEQEDIVRGLDAGADEYLVKPFEPQALQARVRAAARIVGLERRLVKANARLQFLASTDELTGAMNRRAMLKRIAEEANRSVQERTALSLMMLDIDGFKHINDALGHAAGDAVLKEFFHRVGSSLRSCDALGRLGGDEFLVVLPGADEREGTAIGEGALAVIAAHPFRAEGNTPLLVTASAGVAGVDPSTRVETMVMLADRALYEAKRGGGNRVLSASGRGRAAGAMERGS